MSEHPTPFRVEPEIEGHDAYYFGDVPDDWMVCDLLGGELSCWHTKKYIPDVIASSEVVQAKPPDPPKRTLRELIENEVHETYGKASHDHGYLIGSFLDILWSLGIAPDEDMEGKVLVALDREDAGWHARHEYGTGSDGRLAIACQAALSRIQEGAS